MCSRFSEAEDRLLVQILLAITHTKSFAELLRVERISWRKVVDEWPRVNVQKERCRYHWHYSLKSKLLKKELLRLTSTSRNTKHKLKHKSANSNNRRKTANQKNHHKYAHSPDSEEVEFVAVSRKAVEVIEILDDEHETAGSEAVEVIEIFDSDSESADENMMLCSAAEYESNTSLVPTDTTQRLVNLKPFLKVLAVRTFVKHMVKEGEHRLRAILSRTVKYIRRCGFEDQLDFDDLTLSEQIQAHLLTFKKIMIVGDKVYLSAECVSETSSAGFENLNDNKQQLSMKQILKLAKVRSFVKDMVERQEQDLRKILSRTIKHIKRSGYEEQIAVSDLSLKEAIRTHLSNSNKFVIDGDQIHLSTDCESQPSIAQTTQIHPENQQSEDLILLLKRLKVRAFSRDLVKGGEHRLWEILHQTTKHVKQSGDEQEMAVSDIMLQDAIQTYLLSSKKVVIDGDAIYLSVGNESQTTNSEDAPTDGINNEPAALKHLMKVTKVRTFVKNMVKGGEQGLRKILSQTLKYVRQSGHEVLVAVSDMILEEAIQSHLLTFKKIEIEGDKVYLSSESLSTRRSSSIVPLRTYSSPSPSWSTYSPENNGLLNLSSPCRPYQERNMQHTEMHTGLKEWLERADLSQYEEVLVHNGFDSVHRLGSVDSDDLDMMKFKLSHKRNFLSLQRSSLLSSVSPAGSASCSPSKTMLETGAQTSTDTGENDAGCLLDLCYARDYAIGLQENPENVMSSETAVRKTMQYVRNCPQQGVPGIDDSALETAIRSCFASEKSISDDNNTLVNSANLDSRRCLKRKALSLSQQAVNVAPPPKAPRTHTAHYKGVSDVARVLDMCYARDYALGLQGAYGLISIEAIVRKTMKYVRNQTHGEVWHMKDSLLENAIRSWFTS